MIDLWYIYLLFSSKTLLLRLGSCTIHTPITRNTPTKKIVGPCLHRILKTRNCWWFRFFFIYNFPWPSKSTAASVRTNRSKVTVGHAPTFKCYARAEKRKEVISSANLYAFSSVNGSKYLFLLLGQYYTKLEEKHQALEVEKSQCEARTKVRAVHFTTSIPVKSRREMLIKPCVWTLDLDSVNVFFFLSFF